jgi:hypothetical protein
VVICHRCGKYEITDPAKDNIERAFQLDQRGIAHYHSTQDDEGLNPTIALFKEVATAASANFVKKGDIDVPRSIISHVLRKRAEKQPALLTERVLVDVLKNNSLPTPAQQADNFVNFLGGHLSSPSDSYPTAAHIPPANRSMDNIYGLLGMRVSNGEWRDLFFIVMSLVEQKLLSPGDHIQTGGRELPSSVSLTLAGWQKYEELKRLVKDSRKAFVAMEFPKEGGKENYFFQETLLDKFLIPAVKKTGYDLANALRSDPMAGNLHARLEVEIRSSRFVVAELSHHNNGAYWEAGFARALDKPVIYMYNKAIGGSDRPHFDVGSDHYIAWEQDKPEKAAHALKAVIRATLFDEAVLED